MTISPSDVAQRHDHFYADGGWHEIGDRLQQPVMDGTRGELFAWVAMAGAADVDVAVRAAGRALPAWAATPVDERVELLSRLAEGLRARSEELAVLEAHEIGTPISENRGYHVAAAAGYLDIHRELVADIRWQEEYDGALLVREPAGVIGAIVPWNNPLLLLAIKVGAALSAGCTVVLKASELAPLSSYVFAEVADEVGVPPGVINILAGLGVEAGEALVRHAGVAKISFTGSTHTAMRIGELAAASIKPSVFELGGKSASIVLDDGDLEGAVRAALASAFHHNGQFCLATTRLLVPAGRLAEAEEIAAERVRSEWPMGDPTEEATQLGPLITGAQKERVQAMIRSGTRAGARLVSGGPEAPAEWSKGYFVPPTVFSAVTNDMSVAREEIFGPVLSLLAYTDGNDAEAVAMANDSAYGLGGAVWSADSERAQSAARRMQTGTIGINGATWFPRAPTSAWKQSGYGDEGGRQGIEEMLLWKAIVLPEAAS